MTIPRPPREVPILDEDTSQIDSNPIPDFLRTILPAIDEINEYRKASQENTFSREYRNSLE